MRISDWSSDVCSSDLRFKLHTADPFETCIRFGKAGDEVFDRRFVLLARQIERTARAEETVLAQIEARCLGQRQNARPAIAFFPECSRAPGRMIARCILALEHDDARRLADFCCNAGPGPPPPHDCNVVNLLHRLTPPTP